MKIGILGTRGIPNAYGGFEQFAQYLAVGLVKRGHAVWVYNSSEHPYQEKEWMGVSIIHCKDWEGRIGTAGQFIYDYNCLKDARKREFDILLQLGYTSNSVWFRLWPRDMVNIVNMDGLEWKRSKYSKPVQKFLRHAEKWAACHGDILIADSLGIQKHLTDTYNRESIYIPYGAEIPETFDSSIPAQYGLEPGNYYMLMARMEPENNIEMILKGWLRSRRDKPLVLVGNPGNKFGQYLLQTYSNENILFKGAIYEAEKVNSLRYHSALYFHGHSVGGTNPSLLEAMACGAILAAHDNIFNKAVLCEDALYFSNPEGVSSIINGAMTQSVMDEMRRRNIDKIRQLYNWDKIVDDYEKVFLDSSINGAIVTRQQQIV